MDGATKQAIQRNNRAAEFFNEELLERFLFSLENDREFFNDIKKEHFAHGASVSYIEEETPHLITVEYPDGRKEYKECLTISK